METQEPVVPVAFAKRKARGNVRKRTLDEAEDAVSPEDAVSAAIAASGKRSKAIKGGSTFSTKKAGDDKLQTFKFASTKTLQQQGDQGATAVLETETAYDRDARCAGVIEMLLAVDLAHVIVFNKFLPVAGLFENRCFSRSKLPHQKPLMQAPLCTKA